MKFKHGDLVAVQPPRDSKTDYFTAEVLSSGPDGLLLRRGEWDVPYTWEEVEQRKMFKVGHVEPGWFGDNWIYEDQE